MKNHRSIIGMFFLLFSAMLSAQQELDAYLQMAAENNPGLKARFNEYMAALEVAPQVSALPDPGVAFAYFINPVETRVGPQQFRISATQMFPWFGTLQAKENVALQEAKSKYEVFLEARSSLFNQVRSTYFNVYLNRRAMEITRENLSLLNSFKKLAQVKAEAGQVSVLDVYRIEMEMGDLENQVALLADKQVVLETMFNQLLNVDKAQEILVPGVLWTDDLSLEKDQVLDSMAANNHQLLVLSMQEQALSYREELARKQGKPDFSIGLDYTVIGRGENQLAGTDALVFPRVGITIPLYRNKYRAMVNEAVYLQEAKAHERTNQRNLLETVLENAWKEYLDADRRIGLYRSQRELAEKSLALLETEYLTGNQNFEEILRMERKLLGYGLELEKSRSDKQASISFIHYLMGQ